MKEPRHLTARDYKKRKAAIHLFAAFLTFIIYAAAKVAELLPKYNAIADSPQGISTVITVLPATFTESTCPEDNDIVVFGPTLAKPLLLLHLVVSLVIPFDGISAKTLPPV